MTHEKLIKFFSDRPALNIRAIETECGWKSANTLNKYLDGKRPITDKFVNKIIPVILKYGYSE